MNVMRSIGSSDRAYLPALVIWVIIYLVLAYISLILDDPQSRIPVVWFPAGAAVSACLSLPRKFWGVLYTMLFFAWTILLVVLGHHNLYTSVIISLISLSGDFTTAWTVQKAGYRRDDFQKVCIWLLSTVTISALVAVSGAGWLSIRQEFHFVSTVTMWWAANVSGTIIATTVLTGITWEPVRLTLKRIIITFLGIVLVTLSAIFVFSMPPAHPESAGLIYGLACIPVLLAVTVPLAAGSLAGVLSFLALSVIVIFFSWHRTGPFFIQGLFHGEPLLLAQCYLSGTAVLMIFIRLQLRLFDHRVKQHNSIAFRLNANTGLLEWDPDAPPSLSYIVTQLPDLESLLSCVNEDVRPLLQSRWNTVTAGIEVRSELIFLLTLPDGTQHTISEEHLFYLPGERDGFIVGYWSLVPGSVPLNRTEGN